MASAVEKAMDSIVQVFHSYANEDDCLEFDGFDQLMKENCSSFVSTTCPPDTSEDDYIQSLFSGADADADGCITFEEFCTIMATMMQEVYDSTATRVTPM